MVGVAVNVTLVPLQIVEPGLAVMLTAGAALGFTVKVIERTVLVPHALCAATVIAPPVEPAVTVIEEVVEVPVHPLGFVQI